MPEIPATTFPKVLRRLWGLSEPATRCERFSNALGRPAVHQRVRTHRGDYWICAETGQLVRDRFPERAEDQSDSYDEDWRAYLAKGGLPERDLAKRREFLKGFERYRRTGRLFEVGCGVGKILKAAVEAGWRANGNELSPIAAGAARAFSGASVRVGPIERIDLDRGVHDLILINDVFEHLEDPRAVILKLAAALRPGGALFLQTLNAQSLSLYFNPLRWSYYEDGHLFMPTLVSLGHYFKAAGLRVVRLETHSFSTQTTQKDRSRSWMRSKLDKVVSTLAGRLDLGHRVKVLLEREAGV